jgi:hypothetical protein
MLNRFPDAFPRTFSLRFLSIEQQGLLPVGRRINPWYRGPGALAPSHLRSPVWSADSGTKSPAKCHGAGPIARLSYTDNFSFGRPARRLQESCPSTTLLHWGKFPLGFALGCPIHQVGVRPGPAVDPWEARSPATVDLRASLLGDRHQTSRNGTSLSKL